MSRRFQHIVSTGALALVFGLGLTGAASANDVLVGGVQVGPNTNDIRISGDQDANDFTVTQNPNGTVTVTGNNGTTVNGAASYTTPAATPITGEIDIRPGGGDDTVNVNDVDGVEDITIKADTGTNDININGSNISDKLKIRNGAGSIDIDGASSGGRRDIDKGTGTLNPANLNGRGGAWGTPPTPTPTPTPGGGGKKAAGKKAAGKKAATNEAPLNAQKQGLPTNNPGQRGMLPDIQNIPSGSYGGSKGPKTTPKSKY